MLAWGWVVQRGRFNIIAVLDGLRLFACLCGLSIVGAPAALAANECGLGATVTCTSAGNPYAAGITYNNAGQSVTFGSDVTVTSTTGVALTGTGAQTVTVSGTGVAISSSAA